MKKINKKILIFILLILIIGSVIGINIINNNKQYSLTLSENQWIDTNKYNVVDVSVLNEIPAISYEGNGVIYDYFASLTSEYGIKINMTSYKIDEEVDSTYQIKLVDTESKNDITLLKDNMILVSKDKKQFNTLEEITNITVGVLDTDKEKIESYFDDTTIKFVTYDTYSKLKSSLEDKTNPVSAIMIPKTLYASELVSKDFIVSYDFSDLNKYVVFSLNGNENLNNIFKKTYSKWKISNYEKRYNSHLINNYYLFKNLSDLEQKNLKSKSYIYGFIDDGIYNTYENNELTGINGLILRDFNKFSGISITYTKYNSISKLLNDFNNKKVDFILNITNKYNDTAKETISILDKTLVIVSENSNKNNIESLKSLKNKNVLVIKDSIIESKLKELGINVKSYNNTSDLLKDYSNTDTVIIDIENYNFYKTTEFKNSKIDYIINTDEAYKYIINDTEENKNFIELFNFYLNYFNTEELLENNYSQVSYVNSNILIILMIISVILLGYVIIDSINHIKVLIETIKKNKKINLSKEEKLMYIDQLTSLKNRAYLNSKIEEWDASEVYPQAIIILDLNNVSYVNDNYGREEGDKIITEAANILIMNQIQNSEIIRTDGNEFLIYLIGYTEKQIVSYIRKLTKQLKTVSHGFGCASGYSIITDAIKTIDDAVAEATISMKDAKEEIDY